ncbi:hypothetical protein NHQ30_001655 [Ciborinia camelliae]|nr:hypothetical protein NHQ30_001655 [Ciborinia camelliae]
MESSAMVPDFGRRLLPQLVDEIARSDPRRTFASIPKSANLEEGFVDIDYETFARAVNRCAWLIDEQLKGQGPTVVLYIGPLDLRYLVIILGMCKAGHISFLSSHRNSIEAHLSLLEATSCRHVMLPEGAPTVTKKILAARPMETFSLPDLDYFINSDDTIEHYPWHRKFDEMKDKPFLILHTSGSTGIPKPVYVTLGSFSANDAYQLIPSLGGKPTTANYMQGKRIFVAFPLFHAANLAWTLGFNIHAGFICVLPPPGPITLDVVNMVHLHGNVDGDFIPPSTVIDIYKNPDYYSNMTKHVSFIGYTGGSLPKDIGDAISSKIKLMTLVGTTEYFLLPIEIDDDASDWQYLSISPFLGHQFKSAGDGLHELVIVRNPELELFQGVFSTFPHLDSYSSKDLYEQHPTKPNSWIFRARSDDLICFSNAEKLNPVTMEGIVSSNPLVKAAIIGGDGEFQASLLIEPEVYPSTEEDRNRLLEEIWPSVREANRDCPAHGRIMKDFVVLATPERPFPRAGKGTVLRAATLKLYQDDLKALYHSSEPIINHSSETKVAGSIENSANSTTVTTPLSQNSTSPITISAIDARIEAVLERTLTKLLAKLLRPAIAEAISSLDSDDASPAEPQPNNNNPLPDKLPQRATLLPPTFTTALFDIISNTAYLHDLSYSSDLFACGLDSLQLPSLVKEINAFLVKERPGTKLIDNKFVYDNPSIDDIAMALDEQFVGSSD